MGKRKVTTMNMSSSSGSECEDASGEVQKVLLERLDRSVRKKLGGEEQEPMKEKKKKSKAQKEEPMEEDISAEEGNIFEDNCNFDSDSELNNIKETTKPKGNGKGSSQRHIDDLKRLIGNFEDSGQKEEKKQKKKKDTPSIVLQRSRPPPVVVEYDDPRKRAKNRPKKQKEETREKEEEQAEAFNFYKAKHEVQMFGIKGLDEQGKADAKLSLLIKLGAEPPKNQYRNYKTLQEERKKKKLEDEAKRDALKSLGMALPKQKGNKKRKRDINDVGFLDGQIGDYKHGVQVIKKSAMKAGKRK